MKKDKVIYSRLMIAWPEELGMLYDARKVLLMLGIKMSDEHKKRIKYLEKILNASEREDVKHMLKDIAS